MKLKNKLLFVNILFNIVIYNNSYSAADLIDIYKIAEKNDAVIQQARAIFTGTQSEEQITRSDLLPQVNLTAAKSFTVVQNITRPVKLNAQSYIFKLNQTIFDWAKWNTYLRSEPIITSAEKTLYTANQELIIRVVKAYFNILAAQDLVEYNEKQYEATSKLLEESQARLAVGELTVVDVDQVQANLDSISADLIKSRGLIENNIDQLREITNQKVPDLAKINTNTPLPELNPKTVKQWLEIAKKYSLDIQVANADRLVANKDISIAHAGFLPTANLTATYGGGNDKSILGLSNSIEKPYVKNFFINLQIDSPNLNPYGSIAKTDKARALYHKADQKFVEAYRQTQASVTEFFNAANTYREQINALHQSIIAYQAALDSTRASYDVGERTYVIVLDRIEDLYKAKRDHKAAIYRYLASLLQLEQAAGILDINDLGLINTTLGLNNPNKNLIKNRKNITKKYIDNTRA